MPTFEWKGTRGGQAQSGVLRDVEDEDRFHLFVAHHVGDLVGAIAGMSRGSVDAALMWLTDLFLSLPQLPRPDWVAWCSGRLGRRWPGSW